MTREIIFDMPDTYGKYRMVCRFGFDSMVSFAWWGHLQKNVVRKPILFGKTKSVWINIDQCWWSKEIKTVEELKERASKFYYEHVEMPIKIVNNAMEMKE